MLRGNGPCPSLINSNRNRPLQKCYRQHEAMMPSEIQQDSLQPTKRATLDSHPLSDLKEWPGFGGDSRFDSGLDEGNLVLVNSHRSSPSSTAQNTPWHHTDCDP